MDSKGRSNIFIVGTGRCGTSTFYQCMKDVEGYDVRHEVYPLREIEGQTIEIGSNLIPLIPHLKWRFPDAKWVHLIRERESCICSLVNSCSPSMIAYAKCFLRAEVEALEAASYYYDTINSLIYNLVPDAFKLNLETASNQWYDCCKYMDIDGENLWGVKYNAEGSRGRHSATSINTPIDINTPTRKKITFVTPVLALGGVEYWLLSLLKHTSNIFDWSIIVRDTPNPEMYERVKQYANFKVRVGNPDAVIVWGMNDSSILSEYKGPIISVSHGYCAWTEKHIDACRDVATHNVAVSREAVLSFNSDDKVTIIPNGIDINRCIPTRSKGDIRFEWGLKDSERAVGFIGRLSPEKNPVVIAKAVSVLGKKHRAVFIGPRRDTDIIDEIRSICPRSIFIDFTHEIGNVLSALDCLMMASPTEGFCLALAEAMYAKVPVVVTNTGFVPDLAVKPVMISHDSSSEELGEAVLLAMKNNDLRDELHQIIASEYTDEIMGQRWAKYLSLV